MLTVRLTVIKTLLRERFVRSHDIIINVTCKQCGDDLCSYVCVQRRDYLTAMSKQKKFKFDETDDRVCMPK